MFNKFCIFLMFSLSASVMAKIRTKSPGSIVVTGDSHEITLTHVGKATSPDFPNRRCAGKRHDAGEALQRSGLSSASRVTWRDVSLKIRGLDTDLRRS
jgi:hypothetical protein